MSPCWRAAGAPSSRRCGRTVPAQCSAHLPGCNLQRCATLIVPPNLVRGVLLRVCDEGPGGGGVPHTHTHTHTCRHQPPIEPPTPMTHGCALLRTRTRNTVCWCVWWVVVVGEQQPAGGKGGFRLTPCHEQAASHGQPSLPLCRPRQRRLDGGPRQRSGVVPAPLLAGA